MSDELKTGDYVEAQYGGDPMRGWFVAKTDNREWLIEREDGDGHDGSPNRHPIVFKNYSAYEKHPHKNGYWFVYEKPILVNRQIEAMTFPKTSFVASKTRSVGALQVGKIWIKPVDNSVAKKGKK